MISRRNFFQGTRRELEPLGDIERWAEDFPATQFACTVLAKSADGKYFRCPKPARTIVHIGGNDQTYACCDEHQPT